MVITEEIRKLAEKHVKSDRQFVVDVVASIKKRPNKLIVIVDGDDGFTIDDCAELNRALSAELDSNALLKDPYLLEVSTPGLDHPLKLKRQYYKNVGRMVRVKHKESVVEGKLLHVTDDSITLQQETGKGKKKDVKEIEIPFTQIDKTFVLVTFK